MGRLLFPCEGRLILEVAYQSLGMLGPYTVLMIVTLSGYFPILLHIDQLITSMAIFLAVQRNSSSKFEAHG